MRNDARDAGVSLRVVVLASGGGTNFQALVDELHEKPESGIRIVRLLASAPGIGAIGRARRAGIPVGVCPADQHEDGERAAAEERWLEDELRASNPDLVVLAGYLRLIPGSVVERYRGRMINIHPALLPAFGGKGMYGHRVHEAVCGQGVRVTGVTVHFVDEAYDRGAIIAQWPVPVREGDDADALAARVLQEEHRVLPAVVRAFARGAFHLAEPGRCVWEEEDWFPGERFRMA